MTTEEPCDQNTRVSLARLDERIKALTREVERNEKAAADNLALAALEYARRLGELNHAHAEAQRVLGTYLPREKAESLLDAINDKHRKLEGEFRDLRGRLWLPLLMSGAAGAAMAAAAVKMLPP